MAEPVRALQTIPRITLRAQFQNGQLWKARYPSLIRDDLVPEIQFEPAFQVCSNDLYQVEFRFQIVGNDAVFAVDDGGVKWQSLVPDNPTPNVVVELVDDVERKECSVLWTRSGARLTALRIACEPVIPPPDDEAAALTQVEGGVYLAITDPGEVHHFLGRPHSAPPTVSGRVQVVGIDSKSRPVYDLFDVAGDRAVIPAGLAPELAFRVRHGELAELPLALALPPGPFADTTFKTEEGEVVMTYVVPSERPEELLYATAAEQDHLCRMKWHAPSRIASRNGLLCTTGRASTFFAQLNPGSSLRDPHLRAALACVSVDPTVIEPPPCDASGVCTKPRDQWW